MFANAATNTKVRIHIGTLQPYLYRNSFSRLQCSSPGVTCGEGHLVADVANDAPALFLAPVSGCNKVITRSQLLLRQTHPLKF